MNSVQTLQQILEQTQQYSQLSQEPSFTLTDILEEPLDQELIQDNYMDEDDMQGFFQDEEHEDEEQLTTSSKVHQYSSLEIQQVSNSQQPRKETPDNIKNQQGKNQDTPGVVGLANQQETQGRIRTSKTLLNSSKLIINQPQVVVQVRRDQRLKQIPLPAMEQIDNMSFVMLKNVTSLFQDVTNTSIGMPTAISATGDRFLAVGTSMGNIVIFEIGVKGTKMLSTAEQRKFGCISSLSISKDNKYLAAAHENGLITLWDLQYFSLLKQQLPSRSKIIQVLFCSQTSQTFISNDIQGSTFIYTIQKYIWLNLKSQKLFDNKSKTLFYDIRYHQLQTKSGLLAMCSENFVVLLSIRPQVKVIGKIIRPDGIHSSYLPNVQMGRAIIQGLGMRGDIIPMYDILLVSWGKSLYIYRFIPTATSFGEIQQLLIYKHSTAIYNIQYLSQNIFVTLDKHQIFRTLRIDISIPSILQTLEQVDYNRRNKGEASGNKSKQLPLPQGVSISMPANMTKQSQVNCYIIKTMQMQEEVVYQRFLKNKEQRFIKSFTNTVINCTSNSEHKQIFFITKNSIFRGRLHKWTQFLSQVINQQKDLKMAMKLSIQLRNQRLNIFSQKVQVNGKKAQKSVKMFCQVGKIFLEQGLKDVKQNNIQRAKNRQRAQIQVKQIAQDLKQLYQYTIQYFIQLKCEKYLFETIYARVVRNLPSFEYWQLFIQSLRPFITGEKLVRIPSIQVFKQILQYFSQKKSNSPHQDNMKLVDKMITNLQSQSLHYENAVAILAENKLYKALAYMCSVNRDFISPCNKLMTRIVQSGELKHQNAEKEYFEILSEYLTKLISGLYVNDKQIPPKIFQLNVLRDVSLWLSFQDSLGYFLRGAQAQTSNKLGNNYKVLLDWIYKLLQQCSKLRQKHDFHQLVKHLAQALENMQSKQLMRKGPSQGVTKKDHMQHLKDQLALMLVRFSKNVELNQRELTLYIESLYDTEVRMVQTPISKIQFVQLQLFQELYFMHRYFQELHLIKFEDDVVDSSQEKTRYQGICQKKSDWCKYLYNFLLQNLSRNKHQAEQQTDKNDQNGGNASRELGQQQIESSGQLIEQRVDVRSQQLFHSKQRLSQSSSRSNKLAKSTQLFQSLFSTANNVMSLQMPYESSQARICQQKQDQLRSLNLCPLPLNYNLGQLGTPQARQMNCVLVSFILSNSQFEQIDSYVESLIKLESQLVIVYILEHYQLGTVNKKIQVIKEEQVKYFVVRRIVKMIRKIKMQQEQNNQRNSRKENRVWGNEHRSYNKKKLKASLKQKNYSSFLQINPDKTTLSKQTLLFYFKCLSKYKRQKRVYSELKYYIEQYEQFIEQVLKIVQQFDLNSCIALIYEHMGQLEKAFEYYTLVYNQRMQVNVHKLALVQHCHGRFLRQIFIKMMSVCSMIDKNQIWMSLLNAVLEPLVEESKFMRRKKEQVIQLIQKVYVANSNHAFIQELGWVIETTLLQVSSHTSTQQISLVFSQYSQLMNKTFMLNCLKSTMQTYSQSIFIYQTSNLMVINDQASQFQKIYLQNKIKGTSYMPICQICSDVMQYKDKVMVYKCSHMYHKRCVLPDEQRCRKCLLVQVGQSKDYERSAYELQQLKTRKKQSTTIPDTITKSIQIPSNKSLQSQQTKNNKKDHNIQLNKTNTIYRCLAFDQYLQRDQIKFDQFRRDYDNYINRFQ